MAAENNWYHVSSHGAILLCIAAYPDCTIDDIADALSLTKRTVWGVIGGLRRAGMLRIRKDGRRHHYRMNPDAPFRHPLNLEITVGEVFGGVEEALSQSRAS
jgi:hypothetical protein